MRHFPALASSHSIDILYLRGASRSSSRWLYLLERIPEMNPDKGVWLCSASNHSRWSFWLVFGYRRFQAWREVFWEVGTGCHSGLLANRTPCSQPVIARFVWREQEEQTRLVILVIAGFLVKVGLVKTRIYCSWLLRAQDASSGSEAAEGSHQTAILSRMWNHSTSYFSWV